MYLKYYKLVFRHEVPGEMPHKITKYKQKQIFLFRIYYLSI